MKRALHAIASAVVKNDVLWSLLDHSILPLARELEFQRKRISPLRERIDDQPEALRKIFINKVVLHGPFKGMRYPDTLATGSSFFPKILGTYEQELHGLIERICSTGYSEIVDIGCAEGYYAVGLAMKNSAAKIFAFDIDPNAIAQCASMAALNGVDKRLQMGTWCSVEVLAKLAITKRGLVIADCEGYEKELFTGELLSRLEKCDYLIEIHDFIDMTISSQIRKVFEDTHDIEVFASIDDIKKTQTYACPEIEGYDLRVRRKLLAERRPSIMEWFFFTPKGQHDNWNALSHVPAQRP